ncbi:MAG: copper homeostasis protein CutC [Prevotellaceae bacterium]|jgi:copper homeostasis protein|nr:copper homeostasis protein CutC [Prevotellaceae bacterium]
MNTPDIFQFEVCANSVESCRAAQCGGAHRVELCAAIPEGGTTPSAGAVRAARRLLTDTRLHVIIRPRGGDFCYSDEELEIMREDIRFVRQAGADGVVFGCLSPSGELDIRAMDSLMQAAQGMSVTFHRAFDVCVDPLRMLEQLIERGVDRVLTSGGQPTAEQGVSLLQQLHVQARGRIAIMAGCGVTERNIGRIARETGITEFHFSAREVQDSPMRYRNSAVSMGGTVSINEYERAITTEERVRRTIEALRAYSP